MYFGLFSKQEIKLAVMNSLMRATQIHINYESVIHNYIMSNYVTFRSL